ncbi:hypothetical protein HYW55_03065 [Candidatus Gottesmanbacteria bacterium]|nr:hypothetical protein [Candidatus Gottesmanbacteria bacterium]
MRVTKPLLFLLLIILTYPFLIKYVYVAHNQYEQIPLILRILDPSYLSNDWIVNVNSHFSPRYFFTLYIGTISRFIPLHLTYFIHYILTIGLVTLATYYLAVKIFRSSLTSILTTMFILFGQKYTLGGNDLVGRDFDPPRFAFGLASSAITLFFYQKYLISSFLLSLATYIHPLIGFEVATVYFLTLAVIFLRIKLQGKSIYFQVKKFISSFLLFSLLSSFSLITYLKSFSSYSQITIDKETVVTILAKIRAPAHYLPSSWAISDFILFGLILLAGFICFRLLCRTMNFMEKWLLIIPVIFILILCLLASNSAEIDLLYPILFAQFFRLTVIIYWLFAILIYGTCFTHMLVPRKKIIFLFLPVLPFFISHPEVITASGFTHSLYIFLAVTFPLWIILLRKKVIGIFVFSIFYVIVALSLLFKNFPFHFEQLYPLPTPETKIASWARENTVPNAIFLTPLDFYTFRLTANRAIVVDWLVMPFEQSAMVEWAQRIADVSSIDSIFEISEEKARAGFKTITYERLTSLRRKYPFNYVITESTINLPLEKIYTTDQFFIYKF